jgi:hypothetical protein
MNLILGIICTSVLRIALNNVGRRPLQRLCPSIGVNIVGGYDARTEQPEQGGLARTLKFPGIENVGQVPEFPLREGSPNGWAGSRIGIDSELPNGVRMTEWVGRGCEGRTYRAIATGRDAEFTVSTAPDGKATEVTFSDGNGRTFLDLSKLPGLKNGAPVDLGKGWTATRTDEGLQIAYRDTKTNISLDIDTRGVPRSINMHDGRPPLDLPKDGDSCVPNQFDNAKLSPADRDTIVQFKDAILTGNSSEVVRLLEQQEADSYQHLPLILGGLREAMSKQGVNIAYEHGTASTTVDTGVLIVSADGADKAVEFAYDFDSIVAHVFPVSRSARSGGLQVVTVREDVDGALRAVTRRGAEVARQTPYFGSR